MEDTTTKNCQKAFDSSFNGEYIYFIKYQYSQFIFKLWPNATSATVGSDLFELRKQQPRI